MEIFLNGEKCGLLNISKDGLMTVFEADCDLQGDGIYRLYVFQGKQELYLGILEPSAGVWKLRRSISGSQLRYNGVTQPDTAVCLPPGITLESFVAGRENGWESAGDITAYITDELAKAADIHASAALVKKDGDEVLLAFPAAEHEPFNLEPIFCFAEITDIGGRNYAVFRLDNAGQPQMPPTE